MKEAIRILVVEDEIPVASILEKGLVRAGYVVVGVARTVAAAVQLAREARPDLILMDVHLDGGDSGIEAAREIATFSDVPVIYATGDALDDTVTAAVATEPYGYLTKPFGFREMRSAIEVAIHKHAISRRLKESEARYRTLAQVIPQKVWTADNDGQALFFNDEWVRYTGLSLEAGQGGGWLGALQPLDRVSFTAAWERAVAQGSPFEIECRLARAVDQSLRWQIARAVPLTGVDGRRQWFGTFTDIEDEKRREAELRLSEAQKRAVLEAALDAVISMDHKGRILEFNPAAERIFGQPRYEVIGQPFAETVLASASRAAHQQRLRQYLSTGTGSFLGQREQVTGRRADDTEFPLELGFTLVPVIGEPLFTAYARDVSDCQRELAQMALLQKEFAASQARARTLAMLVPTCQACKKVHLPDGAWADFEQYLRHQGPAPTTAVLCPPCEAHLHPERGERKRIRLWSKEV